MPGDWHELGDAISKWRPEIAGIGDVPAAEEPLGPVDDTNPEEGECLGRVERLERPLFELPTEGSRTPAVLETPA
jgi:hypothetical protein